MRQGRRDTELGYCSTGSPDVVTVSVWLLTLCISLTLILGILFSPIGALVCGLLAARRFRGRKVWRYVGVGAVHSALFLFPWIYTVCRLAGWSPPRSLAALAYIIVYSAWLVGSILGVWFLFCVGWSRDALFLRLEDYRVPLSLLQLLTWLGSLTWLYIHPHVVMEVRSRLVYHQPFILLAGWTAFLWIAFAFSL